MFDVSIREFNVGHFEVCEYFLVKLKDYYIGFIYIYFPFTNGELLGGYGWEHGESSHLTAAQKKTFGL